MRCPRGVGSPSREAVLVRPDRPARIGLLLSVPLLALGLGGCPPKGNDKKPVEPAASATPAVACCRSTMPVRCAPAGAAAARGPGGLPALPAQAATSPRHARARRARRAAVPRRAAVDDRHRSRARPATIPRAATPARASRPRAASRTCAATPALVNLAWQPRSAGTAGTPRSSELLAPTSAASSATTSRTALAAHRERAAVPRALRARSAAEPA